VDRRSTHNELQKPLQRLTVASTTSHFFDGYADCSRAHIAQL
jgi:hypothetical protein